MNQNVGKILKFQYGTFLWEVSLSLFLFFVLQACSPFGKSFYKNEHLAKSVGDVIEINLVEDQVVPITEIMVFNFRKGLDCESNFLVTTDNPSLIETSSLKLSDDTPSCFLVFKLVKDAFGIASISIKRIDVSEITADFEIKVNVSRLFDEVLTEHILDFDNQSKYTVNPFDGIEWNQTSATSKHIKLRQIDLVDNAVTSSSTDQNFSNYVSKDESIILDTTNNAVRLSASTSSSGYDSNFAEFSADWTPQWGSIVHYWKMNEENGAMTARDSVGGITTTATSASIFNHTDGWLGKAASFNSATLDTTVAFTPSNNFTLSLWVYVRSLPVEAHIWNTGHSMSTNGWALRIAGGCGTPGIYINVLIGSASCALFGATTREVPLNKWVHYAVRSNSVNQWSIYINGVPYTQFPTSGMTAPSPAMRFASGLNGMVDEVALWNVELGWSDINTIYNRQASKFGGQFTSRVLDIKEIVKPITDLNFSSSIPTNKELYLSGQETSGIPSGFGYVETISNFSQNLVSYFRFNVAPAGIANGQTITATVGPNGSAINGDSGYFAYSTGRNNGIVLLDGNNDAINLGTSINPTSNSFTVSFWERSQPNGVAWWTFVSNRNSGAGNSGFWITQRTDGVPHVGKLRVQLNTTVQTNNYNLGTVNVSDGEWHHIVVVVDRSTNRMHFYVDGQVDVADIDISTVGNISSTTATHIGRDPSTGNSLPAAIDEFAMWHRALSRQEVAELYRRGANRSFYQIRWCEKSDCSDNPSFVGIDGTVSSYLSEVVNTHNYTDTGIVNSTALSFVFSQLGSFFSGFQTWLSQASTKKYFQYRVFMDTLSDSTSSLCDSSNAHYGMSRFTSGSQPCMPDVKAVGFGPDRVYQDYVILNSNFEKDSTKDFGAYESFSVEQTSASCQAELGFQLRPVGSASWYYFTGDKWTFALTNAQKNSAAEVNQNISKFAEQVGRGRLDVRTILKSGDGTKNCEIKQITISGKG